MVAAPSGGRQYEGMGAMTGPGEHGITGAGPGARAARRPPRGVPEVVSGLTAEALATYQPAMAAWERVMQALGSPRLARATMDGTDDRVGADGAPGKPPGARE
jgi:hypothetical protein